MESTPWEWNRNDLNAAQQGDLPRAARDDDKDGGVEGEEATDKDADDAVSPSLPLDTEEAAVGLV